jgi:tetratricopeptide (TPR) repeat protein
VRRYVAEGGMAWVFEVQDPLFERRALALKVLKPDAGHGAELELFGQEAQLLGGIDHPNVVQIFDHGRDETSGLYYYTMTFVDGPSLWELIHEQGAIDPEQACEIFMGVLSGLEQIHSQNVVHRDITPRNILLAPGERAVLMDLGIAREASESEATQYTQVIRGTPLYMSPEQSSGRRPTKSSDIFSLGLTFYYCLRGHTVYDETKQVDAANSHSVREYLGHLKLSNQEFEMKLPRKVPRGIREVMRTACRLDPRQRFQDAREMREALRDALRSSQTGLPRWLPVAAGVGAVAAVLWLARGPVIEAGRPLWDQWTAGEVAEEPVVVEPTRTDAATAEDLAKNARDRALEAQERAQGAEVDSEEYAGSMSKAFEALEEAEKRFAAGGWGDASALYDKAASIYAQSPHVRRANEAWRKAESLLAKAEKLGMDPPNAPVLIARAKRDYQEGRFEEAAQEFEQSIAELEGIVPANVAPRLVARDPPDETILLAGKRQSLALSIEAEDLEDDPLTYRWTVDDKPRDAKEGTLNLASVSKDTLVSVRVSDDKGGELEERWQIEWNEKPKLSIEPRARTVTLEPGQSKRFTARASDPDGDPLTTEFFLDDRKATTGDAYEFEATEEGTHKLVVKTTDEHGASISGVRTIKVAKAAPPPPPKPVAKAPPQPPPKPIAKAPPPVAPPQGPRGAIVATLQEYESAFESCNSGRLRRFWRMSAGQIKAYESICQEGIPKVDARPRDEWGVSDGGDKGWICMQYGVTVDASGTTLILKKNGVYRGDLVKRPDGWQFVDIRAGCRR